MIQRADIPKISVVMSIYNEPLQWIRLAMESILSQTFRDCEYIIICDNPGFDKGIAYISELAGADPRIRLIINEKNIGPTKSFNKAIEAAKGEYIARMDADDIALPTRFEKQVKFLDSHPQISICASDVHVMDPEGRITRKNRYRKKRRQELNVISNCIAHPTVMLRRALLEERNPLYNPDYRYSQDYELWTFLTLKGHRFHTLQEPLLMYRRSASQISSARKQTQVECFKKAHKSFIINWLLDRGIINENDTSYPEKMLQKASTFLRKAKSEDKEYLKMIIFVLYFSLGTYSWKWKMRYLTDRNMIVFRIGFIHTFRLLFSSRTRKDRTGFN